jgi:thiol-disulfide isomerase/thioredoxin
MALLESTMTPLGSSCPDFELPGVDGRNHRLADFTAPALLVIVMCNHCPYVQAVDDRINQLGKDYEGRCDVVGINPNDALAYPEDDFESMKLRSRVKGFVFTYLRDESQATARALGAVCTPDYFLFGHDRKLAYRGRLDDNWKEPSKVQTHELRAALDAVLAGQTPKGLQKPSMGCSIKWR